MTVDMKRLLSMIMVAAALVGSAAPAVAQTEALDTEQRILMAEIQAYLRSVTTFRARFVQVNPSGNTLTGTFYMQRPGRMRIEYDSAPYLYVADGTWLVFWDGELEQRSDAPLGSTLADFFIREDVQLTEDITVVDAARGDGSVQATLVQADDPGAGQLTIVLSDQPRALDRWVVVDAQGQRTEVILTEQEEGLSLDRTLWRAPRPNRTPGQ